MTAEENVDLWNRSDSHEATQSCKASIDKPASLFLHESVYLNLPTSCSHRTRRYSCHRYIYGLLKDVASTDIQLISLHYLGISARVSIVHVSITHNCPKKPQ